MRRIVDEENGMGIGMNKKIWMMRRKTVDQEDVNGNKKIQNQMKNQNQMKTKNQMRKIVDQEDVNMMRKMMLKLKLKRN